MLFTLRDVLWLTVLVTVVVAWLADRSQLLTRLAASESRGAESNRLVDSLLLEWKKEHQAIEESGYVIVESDTNRQHRKLMKLEPQKASPLP